MHRFLIIFFLIILTMLSCKNTPNKDDRILYDPSNPKGFLEDTLKRSKSDKKLISDDFLRLVMRIDSLGYKFDTTRYHKVYSNMIDYPDSPTYYNNNGFIFYSLSFEETIPYLFNEMKLPGSSRYQRDSSKEWKLNYDKFKSVNRIIAYFFSSKIPDSYGNLNFSTDGIIEEWVFLTEKEALEMSEELGKKESFVYFNRGAYICAIDNRVYVFHSRAVAFYSAMQSFFKWFCNVNNAIIPNEGNLRSSF